MKKIIYLVLGVALVGGGAFLIYERRHSSHHEDQAISHYTCPMHPQVHRDKPGDCPICGMKLVPVINTPLPPAGEGQGVRDLSISPERQQLIGLKKAPVERKPAVKEIRTFGRVAFDPELAMAQREYLEIIRGVPSLKAAAISRLRILGMGDDEIRELEQKGTSPNLYLPAEGDPVWVYATLYPNEFDLVKPGQTAEVSVGSDRTFSGKVRAVDPVVDPATRSARARIEVPGAGGILKPEAYVNVLLKVDLGEALVIPKSAVIDTGTRQVAFVVKEGDRFESREIKVGPEVGDGVIIREGLQEGDLVVSSATFLIDSESQLKAAVSGMEHQH